MISDQCWQEDLKPISIEVLDTHLPPKSTKSKSIRVTFPSVASKRTFLQVRRAKKDIFQSDLKLRQGSQRPLVIVEELTKANQHLLYIARSLRPSFQFVWSNNGQILARERKGARVVRIIDESHVATLKLQHGSGNQQPGSTPPRK